MSDDDGACFLTIDPEGAGARWLEPRMPGQTVAMRRKVEGYAEGDGFIAVIENRAFLRDCIRGSLKSATSLPVVTFSTASDLEQQLGNASARLIILSVAESSNEESAKACKVLSELLPGVPIIVFAHKTEADLARTVVRCGAKGYVSWTMGFETVIQVIRFVLAGGTYVPLDIFLEAASSAAILSQGSQATPHQQNMCESTVTAGSAQGTPCQRIPVSSVITRRELAVIQAIQQGKSNKLIAYHLNMCESTVKVHVRNIMKKLAAKNRTEVAIKAQSMLTGMS